MTIVLNKPVAPNLDKLTKYLETVNERGWYTNFGPLHQELTTRLEQYLGVKNLLLISNGTLAIQVACKVLKVHKAVTTPFSFAATSSSLLWQGIDLEYADINRSSLNLNPENARKVIENKKIDAIVTTHVYGNPCEVEMFENISKAFNVKVIYDAAHAFGVNCNGQSVLNYGDASTLSFHATKLFHTVEGGAIIFKKHEDYEAAKRLINFGIQDDGSLGEPGINAKLNEYQCAVGLTILDEIEKIVSLRSQMFSGYVERLKDNAIVPKWHQGATFNGAYMPVVLRSKILKEKVKKDLLANNIQCRDYFSPSLNKVYTNNVEMPTSEDISERVLCLPLHYYMTTDDVNKVCNVVIQSIKGHK